MEENEPLGERMKRYEFAFRRVMPRRAYTLIRLDGRAFHSYLRTAKKPYDEGFAEDMAVTARRLCREVAGVRFAYMQSDEISLLLTDFDSLQTEPFFGGVEFKLTSLTAAIASTSLYGQRFRYPEVPTFDSRVWSMSDPVEVANYFVWRQWDAVRNSIQMLAQAYYTPAQLLNKSTDELQEMLYTDHGINWGRLPAAQKRGQVVARDALTGKWAAEDAPHFKAEPGSWLAGQIPPLPTLWNKEDA